MLLCTVCKKDLDGTYARWSLGRRVCPFCGQKQPPLTKRYRFKQWFRKWFDKAMYNEPNPKGRTSPTGHSQEWEGKK